MSAALTVGARLVLTGVLIASAAVKLRDRPGTHRGLLLAGLPPRVAAPLVPGLPAAELGSAALLLVGWSAWWAALPAVALLVGFTAFVAWTVAKRRRRPCPCFGSTSTGPMGGRTLARNGWLLALGVLAAGSASGASVPAAVAVTALLAAGTAVALRLAG